MAVQVTADRGSSSGGSSSSSTKLVYAQLLLVFQFQDAAWQRRQQQARLQSPPEQQQEQQQQTYQQRPQQYDQLRLHLRQQQQQQAQPWRPLALVKWFKPVARSPDVLTQHGAQLLEVEQMFDRALGRSSSSCAVIDLDAIVRREYIVQNFSATGRYHVSPFKHKC